MKHQLDKIKGIVVALKANYFLVDVDLQINSRSNNYLDKKRFLCTSRNRLRYSERYIAVGDFVFLEELNYDQNTGVVCDVFPRSSFLPRPPVANISDIFAVISLSQPNFDADQVSRFLLAAENTSCSVTIILTKQDLVDKNQLDEHINQLNTWGYKSFAVSIKDGYGISELRNRLEKSTIGVFCGPSGTGKSSLLNYLLPRESIPVGDLSKKLQRGKHKTRHVELFSVAQNSLLADTPGFNRPEIVVEPTDIPVLFPELRKQLVNKRCKFRNCLHLEEPGCAIDKSWERYIYYKQFLESMISFHR